MHIDAHQHFWRYTKAEYDWIDDSMSSIRRDFLPPDLKAELRKAGIDGSVAVQARQTLEETRWLLGLARDYPDVVKGVVGWAPLAAPTLPSLLAELAKDHHLRGLRHVVQSEPDEQFLLGRDFNRGVSALLEFRLTYDILILERHLSVASVFVDRHPNQIFILDHIAKPKIASGQQQPWADHLRELAKRPNVSCKLSGLVTEADTRRWRTEDLLPYMDVVLEAFGPRRILFGSDWPVCLVATTYVRWAHVVQQYIAKLSQVEQDAILGENAQRVYGLPQPGGPTR